MVSYSFYKENFFIKKKNIISNSSEFSSSYKLNVFIFPLGTDCEWIE
jgi:hypothetical protein